MAVTHPLHTETPLSCTLCGALRQLISILSIWLLVSGLALASGTVSSPIIIGNYTLVSVTPAGGKNYDFAYRADVTNKGKTALSSLGLTLTAACRKSFSVIDGELSFGPIAIGKTATSTDTFTIRKSGSTPYTAKKLNDELKWQAATNAAPTANAGPDQTAPRTGIVQLSGSGTDPNGDPLTYRWRFVPPLPAGSLASLLNPTTPAPSFTIDARGTWIAELIVNDGKIDSFPDTVAISTINSAPVANAAGPQTVVVGPNPVTLDGTGSTDADGDHLTYQWTFVTWSGQPTASAPAITTTAPASPDRPTFVVTKPGTYVLQLIVNDGQVNSLPASVTISTLNSPPVAVAKFLPSPVFVGDTITLDASGSTDVDGNTLTYTWTLPTVPAGSNAGLVTDPLLVINPFTSTFKLDKAGTYIAQVLVSDGLASSIDTVTITTQNSPPVSNAGPDQSVYVGTGIPVQLDGSGSKDADLDPLSYSWSFLSYPGSALPGATAPILTSNLGQDKPSFLVNNPGNYTIQLIVNDTHVNSVPDTVVISTLNSRPVAVPEFAPGNPLTGDTITLNGSASSDADHDPLTYSWSFLSQPIGSALSINATADPSKSTFTPLIAGDYVPQLIVNDGKLDSLPVTAIITVGAIVPKTTIVPNVVNQSQAVATTTLTTANLVVGVVTQQNNPTIAAGNVISQTPAAGTTVLLASAVDLVISSGPANQPPTITSTPVTTANVGSVYSYPVIATDPDIGDVLTFSLTQAPAGMAIKSATGVISWSPTALQIGGQAVIVLVTDKLGATATQTFVVQTSGVVLALVPDLTGQPQAQASQILPSVNLKVGAITYVYSNTVPLGSVISQFPVAGSLVSTDTPVDLVISSCLARATIPDVTGQPQAMALTNLNTAGLAAGTITQQTSNTVPAGNVISQSPIAGGSVNVGTTVNLVVSSGLANLPPSITSTPITSAVVGSAYSYTVIATDPNVGDVLTFSLTQAPTGMSINSATGVISWIPTALQTGSQNVTVQVMDKVGATANQPFVVQTSAAVSLIPVPNLIGQTLASAAQTLNQSNLNVGNVMTSFSNGSTLRVSHAGSIDPLTEGFTPTRFGTASTGGPLNNDLGRAAWSVSSLTTDSQFGYSSGALSLSQIAATLNQGFVLTFTARVLPGQVPALAYDAVNHITIANAMFATDTRRYEVDLGLDSVGDTVVVLPTSIDNQGPGSTVRAPGSSFTLTGSGSSYHTYQLVYNPATQLSNLWVDGVVRIQNYAGHTTYISNSGLEFGSFSGGQGNFSFVELASPVPAQSTGLVTSQTPVAGTMVANSSLVDLTLASGSAVAQLITPNVVGLTQAVATTTLTNSGLVAGVITQQYSDTVAAGLVISQIPLAATSVNPGSAVDLIVSLGPIADSVSEFSGVQGSKNWNYGYLTVPGDTNSYVQMSNFLGANPAIQNSGTWSETPTFPPFYTLVWSDGQHSTGMNRGVEHWSVRRWISPISGTVNVAGIIGRMDSGDTIAKIFINGVEKYSFGTVSLTATGGKQNYSLPLKINVGDTLDFALSPNGSDLNDSTMFTVHISPVAPGAFVSIPNVVGLTQVNAISSLTNSGLVVGAISQQNSDTVPTGMIISQAPVNGTLVNSGSAVDLVVSLGALPKWDISTDFSANTTNPNGPWSYGYSPTATDPSFTLYDTRGSRSDNSTIQYWNSLLLSAGSQQEGNPSVEANSSNATESFLTISLQPHQVMLHPGSTGSNSVMKWTAPVSGTYQISATFSGVDIVGTTTDVHVTKTTLACTAQTVTSLFDGDVNGYGATATFNSAVPIYLAAGESVDFRVGYGSNANFLNDSTGLSVNITATAPPPVFSTIYSDKFDLDTTTRLVGADLNGQPVETSSLGPVNWTSANLYIDGKNTFALNAGNGYLAQNQDHSSSLASLPAALSDGIYQLNANIYAPSPATGVVGWIGLGFFLNNSGQFIWEGSMTGVHWMIFDGAADSSWKWNFGANINGVNSSITPVSIGSTKKTISNATAPLVSLTWDTVKNTVSGSLNGVSVFTCNLTGTAVNPSQIKYVGIDRDAALGPNSMVDNFKFSTTAAVAPVMVTTPNVVGTPEIIAISSLNNVGLANGTLTQQADNSIQAGSIISQTPAAGISTIKGNTVNLVISTGPAFISAPNVVGQTQASASSAIAAAGLKVGTITQQSSNTIAAGIVISQSPAAGASVASGSPVNLVISSGPVLIATPSVVGLTQTAAGSAITASQLTVGAITTQSSNTVPIGQVLSQSPAAGVSVAQGSAVNLVVSSGQVLIAVPTVTGLTQTSAQSALLAANLTLGTVTNSSSNSVPIGQVISQLPLGGASVTIGTAVNIVISTGPVTAPLKSLVINSPSSPTILAGNTQALTSIGNNTDGTGQDMTAQVTWTSSNPGVATVSSTGVVTALAAGSATITASQGSINTTIQITVAAQVPTDTIAPTATLNAPLDGSTVTSITAVTGTATDANLLNYVLDYAPEGQTNFTTLATGTTPVNNGTLGNFDPTQLLNDIYTLRLTVYDQGGNSSQSTISVQVARDQKVGNFSVAFQDLNLPLSGIPITVTRVYDSRNKASGDFGFGWSLDVQTIRIHSQRNQGLGWQVTKTGGFFPTYNFVAARPHRVSINLPDGKVEEFDMMPDPASSTLFTFDFPNGIKYQARSGTLGTLVALDQPSLSVQGSQPGIVTLLDTTTFNTYDGPSSFRYTTAEGRIFTFQSGKLISVSDTNGNTITIGANGILHSTGKSIAFIRDAQNRITQITDPNGNKYNYGYDAKGNLASYTDPLTNVTHYTYNFSHGLLEIQDPRGIKPLRNDYDASGRLISTTDSAGNAINYTHDLNTQQEIIKDRLGNITVQEYDADGNVVKTTDALGGVTTRTYDASGNTLSETDPLGRTHSSTYDTRFNKLTETDALGNVSSFTYDASNHPLTVTDPLGHVTTNTYDAKGNPLSVKDPLGNVTSLAYDVAGRLSTQTDALGNVSSFQYDAAGNMTQQTDSLGHVTTSTFDANGNRLSETRTRTLANSSLESLVTRFTYDAANRVIKTTNPDGSITQTVYNSIGKQAQTIDALSHVTRYDYDDFGRMIKTTYPDGAFETSTYDLEGHKISSTDRLGQVTGSTFDPLGRQIKTTYPDATFTQTGYDLAGQQITNTDALGHVTRTVYDAAGRRIKAIDASNTLPVPACGTAGVTCFSYDNAGKQTQVTDGNGNITQFNYDAGSRPIKVTYPDASNDLTAYDALGRKVSKTDQAGKITQYSYNALGQLTQVIDALNQMTRYGYDELGQQVSQTDANGNITHFAYNNRSQRISRTLPAGQIETMTYDIANNLTSKTDFNGKSTTFAYDSLGRLTTKTPDVSLNQLTVTYTYTDSGQRATMQDASGLTTYTYDNRNRLTNKASPQGTLSYSYDLAGNLAAIQSSHINGVSIDYAYDGLNRLASVTDNNLLPGITTYSYDDIGNLAGYNYPNGVATSYTYNSLNRLTLMTLDKTGTPLASYNYTLGATGNRLSVAELSGRTVNYTYDSLYRLTRETVSADPNAINGQVDYGYDPVGNRLSRASTLPGINNQTFTYDANDRLNTDNYDANGNTIGTAGKTYAFDYENHLTGQNGNQVAIVYDGDGNRVSETVGGVTTEYLVDTLNPTGYAQVLEEIQNALVIRRYTYGSDLISQSLNLVTNWQTSFYGYDGHGSVRILYDSLGTQTDTYIYDAFGVQTYKVGSTWNTYLYSGEQADVNLGSYYLRARYAEMNTNRFLNMDYFDGNKFDPLSNHKYLYTKANSVNSSDPTGLVTLMDVMSSSSMQDSLNGVNMSYRFKNTLCAIDSLQDQLAIGKLLFGLATSFAIMPTIQSRYAGVVFQMPMKEGNRFDIKKFDLRLTKQGKDTRWVFAVDFYTKPVFRLSIDAATGSFVDIQAGGNLEIASCKICGVDVGKLDITVRFSPQNGPTAGVELTFLRFKSMVQFMPWPDSAAAISHL